MLVENIQFRHGGLGHVAGHPRQHGQAMVEYAIILTVMVLLVAGGLELAIAAYNGHATGEGAKAGATQWLETLAGAACSGGACTLNGVGLGDHPDSSDDEGDDGAIANFRRPACENTSPHTYDAGLPDGTVDDEEDVDHATRKKVYLYNPLPLDISGCSGMDDNGTPGDSSDDTRSRLSVLIAGHGSQYAGLPDDQFAGLPKLNQAAYAQYEKAFIDTSTGKFIPMRNYDPNNGNHIKLLRLPGWLDLSTDTEMSRLVLLDDAGNVTSRPTFAIRCSAQASPNIWGPCDTATSPADVCWDSATAPNPNSLACNVQVQYRYRHVFESLVTMGVGTGYDPVTDENPIVANVDAGDEGFFSDDAAKPGILGSELALTKKSGERALASRLKARKDFMGCYATTFLENGSNVIAVTATKKDECDYPKLSHP